MQRVAKVDPGLALGGLALSVRTAFPPCRQDSRGTPRGVLILIGDKYGN
jgi:hypothetical protein